MFKEQIFSFLKYRACTFFKEMVKSIVGEKYVYLCILLA